MRWSGRNWNTWGLWVLLLCFETLNGHACVLCFSSLSDSSFSKCIVDNLQLFKTTVSFGSVTSVAEMPILLSHASIPLSERSRVCSIHSCWQHVVLCGLLCYVCVFVCMCVLCLASYDIVLCFACFMCRLWVVLGVALLYVPITILITLISHPSDTVISHGIGHEVTYSWSGFCVAIFAAIWYALHYYV